MAMLATFTAKLTITRSTAERPTSAMRDTWHSRLNALRASRVTVAVPVIDQERPLVVAVELVDAVHRLGREPTGDLHAGLPADHDDAPVDVQRERTLAHPGRSELVTAGS